MNAYRYWQNLAELAQEEMERLESLGLSTPARVSEDTPQETNKLLHEHPLRPDARRVLLDKNQTVWVSPNGTFIDDYGFRYVQVSDEPPRSDVAIVATLTALKALPINPPESVREILPLVERQGGEERPEDLFSSERLGDHGGNVLDELLLEPLVRRLENITPQGQDLAKVEQHIEYVKALLRHYRPGFDELPYEAQAAFIEHTSRYVNEFLKALRKLLEYVHYGTAQGTLSPAVKDAMRDVKVAQLHDVMGLSYLKIGKIIGEDPPKKHTSKKDHATVRKMGDRGRNILEKAFGKEGWKARIAAMKKEAAWWRSLSEGERWIERVAAIRGEPTGTLRTEAHTYLLQALDRKAREQNVTREEAARRWAERYKQTILQKHKPE